MDPATPPPAAPAPSTPPSGAECAQAMGRVLARMALLEDKLDDALAAAAPPPPAAPAPPPPAAPAPILWTTTQSAASSQADRLSALADRRCEYGCPAGLRDAAIVTPTSFYDACAARGGAVRLSSTDGEASSFASASSFATLYEEARGRGAAPIARCSVALLPNRLDCDTWSAEADRCLRPDGGSA